MKGSSISFEIQTLTLEQKSSLFVMHVLRFCVKYMHEKRCVIKIQLNFYVLIPS